MSYQHFLFEVIDQVATITLNRPKKANALTLEAWQEMQAIFSECDNRPDIRVVIMQGAGAHFCSGIDVQVLMSPQIQVESNCEGRAREQLHKFILMLQDTVAAIEKCRKPVIAAVHGGCIGGGLDIAAACDLRYGTVECYFTLKETDMGLVADLGSLQRLPHIIGHGMVAEMAYTARKVPGPEALRMGLINACCETTEELHQKVSDVASMIAAKSPLVIRGVKNALLYQRDNPVRDGLEQVATWNAATMLSADLAESLGAAMEKRTPNYED